MSIKKQINVLFEKLTNDTLVSKIGLEEVVSQIMKYFNIKIQEVKKEVITNQEINQILDKLK